jgi:Xaa-Pro aminopeptidase
MKYSLAKTQTARLKKILSLFKAAKKDIDYLYISKPDADASFSYFSGFPPRNLFYSSLVMSKDGITALVPKIEENSFRNSELGNIECSFFKKGLLKKLISKNSKIGINSKTFTYEAGRNLEKEFSRKNIIDASGEIYAARASKDSYEIDCLQKACSIAARVSLQLPSFIREGMTELSLAKKINDALFEFGSIKPAFETLVGFGRNSALAHPPVSSTRKLSKGDLVLMDFGAMHSSGYVSDMTRTLVFGKASFMQKKMYSAVIAAKTYMESAMCTGVSLKDVQDNVSELIKNKPGELTHAVGHSIGLEVHDGLSFGQDTKMPDNYVTAVEPALYNSNVGGIRVEDDYMVAKKSVVRITRKALPEKELIEL